MTGAGAGVPLAIELRGLHKAFRGNPVLRGVDLAIREGETFTILGGSGSGKSVCLKHMIGLLKPDAGRVIVFGRDITELGEDQLVDVRKARLDGLPERGAVRFAERLRERGLPAARAPGLAGAAGSRERVASLPRGGGPAEQRGARCPPSSRAECASGWGWRARSRWSRARSSTTSPPPGSIPANQNRIGELIRALQRRLRITSVVVTHELELCFAISNRVALLKDGRIAAVGTADEIRRSAASRRHGIPRRQPATRSQSLSAGAPIEQGGSRWTVTADSA